MENNKSPICDTCSKASGLDWKGSVGSTGAYLDTVGFIYKNAVLYTGKDTPLAFCSNECHRKFYDEVLNIPEEKQKKVKDMMDGVKEAIKKDIPKMAEHFNQVSKALKGLKERRNNGKA